MFNQNKKDFVADLAEIDRRMENWRTFLQPYFDNMALPKFKQDMLYESLRLGIPDELSEESRGVARWQIFNARQKRLAAPHQITEHEFSEILLPALQHISYIPGPEAMSFYGITLRTAMFQCASTDWSEQRAGKEKLIGKCDNLYVSTFIHIAADNYRVLMKCEQEGVSRVKAIYVHPACERCQNDEYVIMDAAQILAAIRAGIYPFAHVINNTDLIEEGGEIEDVYLCPGPKLMLFDNGIDPAKFDKFMSAVKASQAKYQAEAAAKQKGNQ